MSSPNKSSFESFFSELSTISKSSSPSFSSTFNGATFATAADYTENGVANPRTANILVTVAGINPQIVTVNQEGTVAIQDIHGGELRIFPNPTNGIFTITAADGNQSLMDVSVQNIQGQTILKKLCKGEKEYHIDLSFAAQGTYHITIVTDQITLSRKLIIIK